MTVKQETVLKCICDRCHYEWNPRDEKIPRVCPQCKSYKWNTENKEVKP